MSVSLGYVWRYPMVFKKEAHVYGSWVVVMVGECLIPRMVGSIVGVDWLFLAIFFVCTSQELLPS
jgi:hypothetical protein